MRPDQPVTTVFMLAAAAVVLALPARSAAGGRQGSAAGAVVVCGKQTNANAVKLRGGTQCRANERPVPVDAATVQGFTPRQLMEGHAASTGIPGTGLAVVDDVGQLVGYLMEVDGTYYQSNGHTMILIGSERVIRPAGSAPLVAIPLNTYALPRPVGTDAGKVVIGIGRPSRSIEYYYESSDCSGQPLLLSDRVMVRDAQIDGTHVVYAGDLSVDPDQQLRARPIQSWSRPADDDVPGPPHCSTDAGDPVSVLIDGGRCCFSKPTADVRLAGPLVSEELPAFVEPLHIAGF